MRLERGIHSAWIPEYPECCGLDDIPGSRKPGHWIGSNPKRKVPQLKSPVHLDIPRCCGMNSSLLLGRSSLDLRLLIHKRKFVREQEHLCVLFPSCQELRRG